MAEPCLQDEGPHSPASRKTACWWLTDESLSRHCSQQNEAAAPWGSRLSGEALIRRLTSGPKGLGPVLTSMLLESHLSLSPPWDSLVNKQVNNKQLSQQQKRE